jgi:teichuronic acid biosynthesis glycosyltransferase TuaC
MSATGPTAPRLQSGAGRVPRLVVLSTVYPNANQPLHGLFVQERVARVAAHFETIVVAPLPWFPFQWVIRRWRPFFRPGVPRSEAENDIEVQYPRFFSVPGALKSLDGFFLAVCCLPTLLRLRRRFPFDAIDAHFAYPEGYAATLLGRWLRLPVTITLRGTIVPLSRSAIRRRLIIRALGRAERVFAVCDALKRFAVSLGINAAKIRVVANGADTAKFRPMPQDEARHKLGLPLNVPIVVSVGGLVERKGFHRVIACLPSLRQAFPGLRFLVVGGGGAEGDWSDRLRRQVTELNLQGAVDFLGPVPSRDLPVVLSAADVFALATRNEGWANVFLEAMACGLPVVTTDVGGNAEVVCRSELGTVVPFGDPNALQAALADALTRRWDRDAIVAYARANSWEDRVAVLKDEFQLLIGSHTDAAIAESGRDERCIQQS